MHNIFIPAYKFDYLNYLVKFHPINDNENIILVLDDRTISEEEANHFIIENKCISSYIWQKDVIEFCRENYFKESATYLEILQNYRVSIKLLIFVYAKYKLNIDKSFLLDDDTLFLKNLDDIWQHDYAIKVDLFSNFCWPTPQNLIIQSIIKEIWDDTNLISKKQFLNSGTLLYTWSDSIPYLEIIGKFFNNKKLNHNLKQKLKLGNNNKIPGRFWVIEQYIFSIILSYVDNAYVFKNEDVYLHMGNNIKTVKIKDRNIIHMIPKNKNVIFEAYIEKVNK